MAYSEDYRKRVIEYRKEGHTLQQTHEEIKLKEEGTLKKKPVKRTFRKLDPEKVRLYFAQHPDAYLREAAEEFECCETTITYACRKLKITRKKRRRITESKNLKE